MVEQGGCPKVNREKPDGLIIYKPEDAGYQKLHLCEYLRELYESIEDEKEPPSQKKKDFRRHIPKKCG